MTNRRLYIIAFTTTVLVYLWTLNSRLVLDDYMHFFIFDHTDWSSLLCIADSRNWVQWIRPFFWVTFCLERWVLGDALVLYRLVSIALYASAVMMFANIVTAAFKVPKKTIQMTVLLLVVYPGSFQTIIWISAFHELLFINTFFASVWAAGLALKNNRWQVMLPLSIVLYGISLGTKETAVIMPVFALIFFWRYGKRAFLMMGSYGFCTVLYFCYRTFLLGGLGGYDAVTRIAPLTQISGLLHSVTVVLPASFLVPLPWETPEIPGYLIFCAAIAFWSLIFVLVCRQSNHRFIVIKSIINIFLFTAPVIPVIWLQTGHPVAPRYLLGGSFWLCFLLSHIIMNLKPGTARTASIVALVLVWIPLLVWNQSSYVQAGRVTDRVLSDLENYCTELASGTQIVVTGLPEKKGAVNINHPHEILTVFNLEILNRCHLLPEFDPCRDLGEKNFPAYLESSPGVISMVKESDLGEIQRSPIRENQLILDFGTSSP